MMRSNIFLIVLIVIFTFGCGTSKELNENTDDLAKKHLRNLRSLNEQKRSNAAVALFKMKHPKALDACIKTINDEDSLEDRKEAQRVGVDSTS